MKDDDDPLLVLLKQCADDNLALASKYEARMHTEGAMRLRAVGNLLYAIIGGGGGTILPAELPEPRKIPDQRTCDHHMECTWCGARALSDEADVDAVRVSSSPKACDVACRCQQCAPGGETDEEHETRMERLNNS